VTAPALARPLADKNGTFVRGKSIAEHHANAANEYGALAALTLSPLPRSFESVGARRWRGLLRLCTRPAHRTQLQFRARLYQREHRLPRGARRCARPAQRTLS